MTSPDIQKETAERYIELITAIRGNIQDFLSEYKRNDEIENWDSVAACTNAILQVDISAHSAIEWIEVKAGIRPDPRDEEFKLPWEQPEITETDSEDESHGSYL